MSAAPVRAQRVRGVPGVGLRTVDGREWLRWGRGYRWDPHTLDEPCDPFWVIARCDHNGQREIPADHWHRTELGLRWQICADCCGIEGRFRVQSCTRPGRYGNPWRPSKPSRLTDGTKVWTIERPAERPEWTHVHPLNTDRNDPHNDLNWCTSLANTRSACRRTFQDGPLPRWPLDWFEDLATYDALSCFCPLDKRCHVDAIIIEGRKRGVWT